MYESSYYTLNDDINYNIDKFSIYNYICNKLDKSKIKFSIKSEMKYNKNFECLNDVYKSPVYYDFIYNGLYNYEKNSILTNEYLLWMLIKSYINFKEELLNYLKIKTKIIEILNIMINKEKENELLKYLINELKKNKLLKDEEKKEEEKVNEDEKKRKELIFKRLEKIKKKQKSFNKILPKDIILTPKKMNEEECVICRDNDEKKIFIYYGFNSQSGLYNKNVEIYSFCGHLIHSNCYINITNDPNYQNHRQQSSPFQTNYKDRNEIDMCVICKMFYNMVLSTVKKGEIDKSDLLSILKCNDKFYNHNYKYPFPTLNTNDYCGLFFGRKNDIINLVINNLYHYLSLNKIIKPFETIQSLYLSCQV